MGLNKNLRYKIELQTINSFDEECLLAQKVEQQNEESKSLNLYGINQTNLPLLHLKMTLPKIMIKITKQRSSTINVVKDKSIAASTPKHHLEKASAKKTIFFYCQGQGYVAKEYPYKFSMIREGRLLYVQHGNDFMEEEDDKLKTIICYAEPEENMLLTQKEMNQHKQDSPRSVSRATFSTPKF